MILRRCVGLVHPNVLPFAADIGGGKNPVGFEGVGLTHRKFPTADNGVIRTVRRLCPRMSGFSNTRRRRKSRPGSFKYFLEARLGTVIFEVSFVQGDGTMNGVDKERSRGMRNIRSGDGAPCDIIVSPSGFILPVSGAHPCE